MLTSLYTDLKSVLWPESKKCAKPGTRDQADWQGRAPGNVGDKKRLRLNCVTCEEVGAGRDRVGVLPIVVICFILENCG